MNLFDPKKRSSRTESDDTVVVEVMIEIPKGERNKYEYDHERNVIKFNRALYSSVHYPSDYGFITNTLAKDGDALDALVLVWEPTFPGCIIEAKPLGVFEMSDEKGQDEKILCVPNSDPFWNFASNISQVPQHLLKEIEHFFSVYKDLEKKRVKIYGWQGKETALEVIEDAKNRYKNRKSE